MLDLNYPAPKIPGPKPPGYPSPAKSRCHLPMYYRAYAWLLDNGAILFWVWAGLTFSISALTDDWRLFAWGLMIPVIAACTLFAAAFVSIMATRFFIRILK